ncbi:hypothetical protein CLF_107933, partial [Clonorchis sinensis]
GTRAERFSAICWGKTRKLVKRIRKHFSRQNPAKLNYPAENDRVKQLTPVTRSMRTSRFMSSTEYPMDCDYQSDGFAWLQPKHSVIGVAELWEGMSQCLAREFNDRMVRGSHPTSTSRLPLSRPGEPGSMSVFVLPSDGMAICLSFTISSATFGYVVFEQPLPITVKHLDKLVEHRIRKHYWSAARYELPTRTARQSTASYMSIEEYKQDMPLRYSLRPKTTGFPPRMEDEPEIWPITRGLAFTEAPGIGVRIVAGNAIGDLCFLDLRLPKESIVVADGEDCETPLCPGQIKSRGARAPEPPVGVRTLPGASGSITGLACGGAGFANSPVVNPAALFESQPVLIASSLDRYLRIYNRDTGDRLAKLYAKLPITSFLISDSADFSAVDRLSKQTVEKAEADGKGDANAEETSESEEEFDELWNQLEPVDDEAMDGEPKRKKGRRKLVLYAKLPITSFLISDSADFSAVDRLSKQTVEKAEADGKGDANAEETSESEEEFDELWNQLEPVDDEAMDGEPKRKKGVFVAYYEDFGGKCTIYFWLVELGRIP